ncbi:MAG: rRNA cytosine-C5-methyltransferase [Paludibacteraceae bacterium]|nr:rRNA cytosine-C5-methyltransferase [Paludibacteraceae bacterium]
MQLPTQFEDSMKAALGGEYDAFRAALDQDPQVSIRINTRKLSAPTKGAEVPWCATGQYLDKRPSFTLDPLLHAGCYYVQEASSMFVEQVYRQFIDTEAPVVLDLCAAPGGKSTHLASLLGGKGWLVSNEVMRNRVNILRENIIKWGAPNVTVTNNDPADFGKLTGLFDLILVDAPCSGEGMFRKDEQAVEEWSPENVRFCAERQRRILADIFPALSEGGILIFSTCTYNEEEDEQNVHWIAEELGAEILRIETDPAWNVTETDAGYHFYPHKTRGEGFFLSALRKTEEEPSYKRKKKKEAKVALPPSTKELTNWLTEPVKLTAHNDVVYAIPADQADLVDMLSEHLRVLQSGVEVATVKGKDLIPSQHLALAWTLRNGVFPTVDLTWQEAITYLRKENLTLPADAPKGYLLLTYRSVPLGWVKNLGNRCNNLHTQEWRIRMQVDGLEFNDFLEL